MKTLILLTIGVIIMSLFSVNAWDNGFEAGEEWQKRKNNGG